MISVIGIYSINTGKKMFPFLTVNVVGFFTGVVVIQLVYLFAREKPKEYAGVSNNNKVDNKPVTSNKKLDDVAGLEEVKEEVLEITDFINNYQKYKSIGAKIPKGILFYGPPGTGKTLLASALAGETNSGFLYASGSEFIEKYVGVGAKRIRQLFANARKNSPCIVFIDEIDAIGGTRTNEGQSEGNQTLNQLLTEMDGFKEEVKDEIIIVIGATNRLDILDTALLRPGRFDKHIYIGNPNKIAREKILMVHTKNKPLSENVDLELIATKTHGLSGAHLSNIANEAAILAVRKNRDFIIQNDFDEAIERVIAGLKIKNSTVTDKERKIISYHEAGHALVGKILNVNSIDKISIVPTGKALGYVLNTSNEDKYLYTKSDLYKKINSLLAGRAAEEIIFKEVTTGAKDDLNKATNIIFDMICEYGMSDFGNRAFNDRMINGSINRINEEVNKNIVFCYEETLKILNENKDCLIDLAEHLFRKETLSGEELDFYIEKYNSVI